MSEKWYLIVFPELWQGNSLSLLIDNQEKKINSVAGTL